MSFDTCVVSLDLNSRLPIPALRKLATKYTKSGVESETALRLALNDQLEAARMQEHAIVKAVRSAWAASDQTAATPAAEQQRQAGEMPDLNEMFTQLLAEEAAAKPPSDDLNSMFGELLAEVSGVDPRPTVAEVVADKPKKARAKKAAKEAPAARAMTHEGRAVDGKPLMPGDVFATASGRETTPFPKQAAQKYLTQWVIDNAAAEAEARGDELNARVFRAEKPGKNGFIPPASNDSMHEYLFGQQPAVMPKMAKPLAPTERPLAAAGLTSYRYNGPMGPVMIGAKNDAEALKEAGRSITDLRHEIDRSNLEVWHDHSKSYIPVDEAPKTSRITPEAFIRKYAKTPADVPNDKIRKILLDAGPMIQAVAGILGEQPHLVTAVGDAMAGQGFKFERFDGPNMTPIFSKPEQPVFTKPGAKQEAAAPSDDTNMELLVKVAADSIGELRKVDVLRVLESNPRNVEKLAQYITDQRPDLAQEVAEVMRDELGKDWTPARTAGAAAVSAAKNLAGGTVDVLDALGALFGGSPGTFGSGPVFNDETYAKAVPLFKQALAKYGQAGQDIRDTMRTIIKALLDKFGYDTTAKMQPYIVRFTDEYRAGKHQGENNVDEGTAGSVAGREGNRADEKPATEQDIFDVSGAADGTTSGTGRESDLAGRGQRDGAGVSGRDAAPTGKAGDQFVHPGESGSDGGATERGDTSGSGAAGREGTGSDRQPGGDAAGAARARAAQDDKLTQQRQASRVPVKLGDRANIEDTLPYLLAPQRDDVAFAEKRFAAAGPDSMPGVMFTNGTGTGKTASGAGIIARQIRAGKTEGMIVVPNTGIAKDWIEFSARLGVDLKMLDSTSENGGSGPTITTYANFGANKTLADREYDWLVADESHYLMAAKDGKMTDALATFRALTGHPDGFSTYMQMRNRDLYDKLGSITNKTGPEAQEIHRQLLDRKGVDQANYRTKPHERAKAIFLSATPFAYVKSVDYAQGYLFDYPADGKIGNSNQDGRAKFFVQHFGYRIRYHKLTEPDGNVDVGLMARQFNNYLKQTGALSSRMLEVDADYGRRFIKVESALGEKVDEGMEFMREHPEYKHLYGPFMKGFDYLKRRYLLEAIKAKEALPVIQQHLDMGRKVIVIHDYKKGGAFNPFHMTGMNGTTTAYDSSMSPKTIDLAELADKFKAERPDLVRLQFPATSALQTLQSAFPNALVHNGSIPEKQLENNKVLFNSDDSGRNVILLQSDKGREGISLHDTTGVHQRVEVIVGMAAKPTALIQLEGRAYRTGQRSNAVFDYLMTGTAWERWTFAQTIAERTDIAEALAMGDDARAMKDAIVEAFENAGPHAITENDGTGGKARDRQAAKTVTDWDRARSFYYGQLKRNSSNKALEGKDYFATPEPVGLKMVEWADIRPGEDVLEPSAGHGAIARWFPTLSNKTIIEPSTALITRARLVVDGSARFIQSDFEEHHVSNKYDAIVMNPPFGSGGSTAVAHVRKAYERLRDGGRIVALLPRGPAADAKLEKLLYGDAAPKDLYMVADIEMPGSTFSRAGTGVMTHIVVLDKISDPSKAPQQVSRDYASADDVDELFERIQHSTVPGRVKTDQPIEIAIEQGKTAPKKQPREAAAGATGAERFYSTFEFKHTKTGDQMYGAAMLNRTSMDTYKDAAAIAKQHGGWYNKFVGGGALRGFLFKDADARAQFMEEAGQLAEVSEGHDQAENDAAGGMTFENIDRRTHSVQVDGVRRPIENSRGQLVAADMNKQLAFWRWFSDSKVVDEHGRPQVYYHATNADFSQFVSKNGRYGRKTFSFHPNADWALQYGKFLMPVYLQMNNPFDFRRDDHMEQLLTVLKGDKGYETWWDKEARKGDWEMLEKKSVQRWIKQQGHDGFYVNDNTGDEPVIQLFRPEQIKSATGNNGQFDPANPRITEDIGGLMTDSPLVADTEPKRVATTQKLKSFRRQLEEGKITAEMHAALVGGLINELDERNAARGMPKPRERGPEWIEERLMRASRTGELHPEEVSFARWLLADAQHLAADLGISLRERKDNATGMYNHIARVITLFKGDHNNGTAVHEILHHTERMMPDAVQAKIVQAWGNAWARAYDKADEKTRAALLDMIEMATDRDARERVHAAFRDGVLKYDEHYQLANASEYWAVNATRLMKGRYEAGSWIGQAKQWLRELVEKAKGLLGMESDAPVLAGLRAVLDGTGAMVSPLMLAERQFGRQLKGKSENIGEDSAPTFENMGQPAPAATWAMPEDTRMNTVRQALQDQHLDTKHVVKAVREAAGDLGDKWDPYLQEELYHGRSATGFKDFLHDELRPLLMDMQARGVSLPELEEYLHMRHAGEANDYLAEINPGSPDGLAGVSTKDAKDYLGNLSPAKARAYAALAARVDTIIKGTQQLLVTSGLEKQETIDAWNGTYQHYVPLHREDMANGMRGNGTGSGFAVRGPASKARTGSKRAVVDILANIAMARERNIVRAEKNRVPMAMYGLALQAPNTQFWRPVNPKKNPAALDAELLNMGLSPAERANIMGEPRSRRVGQSGMVESYINLAARNEPNVLPVRINGEDRFLFFNKDDPRAMRMAEAMKNMGAGELDWTMSQVAKATRWMAAMNTQYNPIFGIVNLVRDTGEGSLNLSSTPIKGKQLQVLAESAKLFGKVVLARGRLSNLSGADAALWREFQDEGGITGFRQMFARSENRTEELARELRAMSRNPVIKAGSAIMDWLSDYNEALENITRLAAYKVAKDNGLTSQRAASLAKNLTVNFNRKGAKTRQLSAFYAFFNAAVQGIARSAETMAAPAGKLIIAGGLLLGAMQSTMLHTWGFDDADIPAFVRAKNIIVPVSRPGHGKNFVSIPLPQGFAFLPTLGQTAADFAFNGGKQAGKYGARVLDTMLDTFNPIGGSGNVMQMLSPTFADPGTDIWGNRDWTGKKIAIEDHDQLHPTPGHTRVRDTATAHAKWMSHAINTLTGGTEYSPGAASPTPDQIDYFIGGFTGGVGRELAKAQQTVSAQFTGEDVPWNKVPLIGRFYGDVNDKSAISTKFYDNVKDLADLVAEVKGRRKDHVDTKQFRAEHPDYKLGLQSEDVLHELSGLRDQRRHWLEKGDKVRVKEYELRMRKVMEKFNDRVKEARAAAH